MSNSSEVSSPSTLQAYEPLSIRWQLACDVTTSLPSTRPEALAEGSAQIDTVLASDVAQCEGFERIVPALYMSPWLVDVLIKQPEDMQVMIRDPELIDTIDYQAWLAECLPNTLTEEEYMARIRRLRNQHMARIALRDLLGVATLEHTLSDVSNFAHACVASASAYARHALTQRHGLPLSNDGRELDFMVLGMGKLGGQELNFSSDIDLIFFYPEQGETNGDKPLDNQTYFVRLGQHVIKLLDARTANGFVFRVDMRLRPFGDSGALAISIAAAEKYYQGQGREWERYAMIKACALYGDGVDIEDLRSRVIPFVYRRYLDFSAIQSLRELKQMIVAQVHKKGMQDNIKLGAGGIREIEFIAQAFQIIYGGKRIELQQRSLVNVLATLSEQDLLPRDVVEALLDAYAFLRKTENRLQMMRDEQTHDLPESEVERARLAYSMGFADWNSFERVLNQYRDTVDTHFKAVFEEEKVEQSELEQHWLGYASDEGEENAHVLAEALGVDEHGRDECVRILNAFKRASAWKQASEEAQHRLNALMPVFFEEVALLEEGHKCGAQSEKVAAFKRGIDLVRAVLRRSNYLVLLYENRPALKRLLNLFAHSEWVAEQIIAQPLLLDTLLDERQLLNVRDAQAMRHELNQFIVADTEEAVLEGMRQFKNANTLSVAAVDLSGLMPLMKVSDHLTTCAEVLVERTHQLAWDNMVERHGVPTCLSEGEPMNASMCVIGYGKLGGIELGYSSDLDVVFLHNSKKEKSYTTGRANGAGVIDNTLFFARLAQRFSSVMQTHTLGGQLYEVDTRLRPDGNSGEWVKSLEGFEKYQMNDAWTWEHQALVRARFISGQQALEDQFNDIRQRVLCQPREPKALLKEVVDMREKIRESVQHDKTHFKGQWVNLKKDRGGLTDIEFMVQYAVLAYAHQHPSLVEYTDNIQLLAQMGHVGVMDARDCDILIESYRQIRARIHRLALNKEKALVNDLGELAPVVQSVADIWHRFMATEQ